MKIAATPILFRQRNSTPIWEVARNTIEQSAGVVHPHAVRIITPLPEHVALESCKLNKELSQLIRQYEPEVGNGGLYPHQAEFLRAFATNPKGDFIATTATGSGKSLCFWVWVFESLRRDPSATALLCFPTQALMWGQAERMGRLSKPLVREFPNSGETPYAGVLRIGNQRIGWTIWQGITGNSDMREHENSAAFKAARIRIATLDKAHYSLFQGETNKRFASVLRCLVLDEAHMYDGVFGANVHYFVKRVYLGSDLKGRERPNLFLASATLSGAREFAGALLSLSPSHIIHIEDSTRQQVDLVAAKDVPELLKRPCTSGLSRFVLLLDGPNVGPLLERLLRQTSYLGSQVNAIYFSQSKCHSRRLHLALAGRGRKVIVYDADVPPKKRREYEKTLNDSTTHGVTVLGTSALELGVDIEGLDVCLMDYTPPRRVDLLQRIGRVGRRCGSHGLVVLRLSAEPHDRDTLSNPTSAFQLDCNRTLPIPLHLEMLRWRSMLAAFTEWMSELCCGDVSWQRFNEALQRHFGANPVPTYAELKEEFGERYGQLVDTGEKAWVYKGFRATASAGKVPLLNGKQEIARIDDIAVFRDAHPGAVYLADDGQRYRVVDYQGHFKIAEWSDPRSDTILGKWLKTIDSVLVRPEPARILTRGDWTDAYYPWELADAAGHLEPPRQGSLKFGIWNYERRWAGYTERDLDSYTPVRKVNIEDAKAEFAHAMSAGKVYPFLHRFSYRTLGWQWDFGRINGRGPDGAPVLSTTVEGLLEHFVAAAIESKPEDLSVDFDLQTHKLRVLDSAPGGNGLSEALLVQGRMLQALERLSLELKKHVGTRTRKIDQFESYQRSLGLDPSKHSAQELLDVVYELQLRWAG